VQSGRKDVYWFRQKLSYVQWIQLLLMLSCTEVLVVGVTSFVVLARCVFLVFCVCSIGGPFDVPPASPFIVFKGRARVTFVVKR
jgi:hypothetical protein